MCTGEEEEVHGEIRGAARLAEALQAHVWPQMTMKSGGVGMSAGGVGMSAEATHTLTKELLSEDEKMLSEGLDEEKGESFEELFAKFADMKG